MAMGTTPLCVSTGEIEIRGGCVATGSRRDPMLMLCDPPTGMMVIGIGCGDGGVGKAGATTGVGHAIGGLGTEITGAGRDGIGAGDATGLGSSCVSHGDVDAMGLVVIGVGTEIFVPFVRAVRLVMPVALK